MSEQAVNDTGRSGEGDGGTDDRLKSADRSGPGNVLTVELRPVPESVTTARNACSELLGDLRIDPDSLGSALVVVTELVANGVMHAGTSLGLAIAVFGTAVRIEVSDGNGDTVRSGLSGKKASGGRGLVLVDALSDGRWGVIYENGRKRVWAEIDLEPAE